MYTAGNMGGAEARCLNIKMVSESLSMACVSGAIHEVTSFGVYMRDSEADQRGLCTDSAFLVDTGMDCSSLSSKDSAFY